MAVWLIKLLLLRTSIKPLQAARKVAVNHLLAAQAVPRAAATPPLAAQARAATFQAAVPPAASLPVKLLSQVNLQSPQALASQLTAIINQLQMPQPAVQGRG